MAEYGQEDQETQRPDDETRAQARTLIESIETEFGFKQKQATPEWGHFHHDTNERLFGEEAGTPEGRLVASHVLDVMMGDFQFPFLRLDRTINPVSIWQSYDASRVAVSNELQLLGKPPCEVTLSNVLGAAKRAEAWYLELDRESKDDVHRLDVHDYRQMQQSISDALAPPPPPPSPSII